MQYKKSLSIMGVSVAVAFVLCGCASDGFSLGNIPASSSYKFLNMPANKAASLTALRAGAMKVQPGTPLEEKFNPSLLKTLDYELGSVLMDDVDKNSVRVDKLTIRWIDPNENRESIAAALGGVVGKMVVADITGQRKDSLLCYFSGEYHEKVIQIKKTEQCPEGLRYCFGSSSMKPLDTSLEITKNLVQKLAKECIEEVATSIRSVKSSS